MREFTVKARNATEFVEMWTKYHSIEKFHIESYHSMNGYTTIRFYLQGESGYYRTNESYATYREMSIRRRRLREMGY